MSTYTRFKRKPTVVYEEKRRQRDQRKFHQSLVCSENTQSLDGVENPAPKEGSEKADCK